MRWKVPEGLTTKEEKLVARMRRKSRFYVFLREIRGQLFDDEFQAELAKAYSPRGQDPVPPALLAMVSRGKAPFGQGSLPRFRERLIEHDLDRRLLDRTVELAKETGGFGWQKLKAALDSSPLSGCGRVEDSWNLIGHAMSRMVAVMAKNGDVPQEEIIDSAGNPEVRDATALLERVLGQDTEPDPDRPNRVRIKRAVTRDRICSVGDPDMRHGRKSSAKAFNGYKRYVAVHLNLPLILAAEVHPANVPEHESVPSLFEAVRRYGELEALAIDRAFLNHPDVAALQRRGTAIACRPWPLQNHTGRFSKSEFRIDLRSRLVTCPAGETTPYSRTKLEAVFDAGTCNVCELRPECTASPNGRSVQIHPQEGLHRRLRKLARTKHGRADLRERVVVEHRLARIDRSQSRRARYKGTRKNTFDVRRHAALVNLVELGSALAA